MNTLASRSDWPNVRVALTALPVLLHIILLISFAIEVPWIDDYYWYFDFLLKAERAVSFQEWLSVVTTPYNNHFHVFQRSIIQIVTWVTGVVPMVGLMWLGNLFYICLFYYFASEKKTAYKSWMTAGTLVTAWLFLNPVSYYNIFECAFFNLPVLLFSFLAIRQSGRGQYLSGIAWGIAATFSNGNGLLVWLVLVMMSLPRLDWRWMIRHGLIFIFFALLHHILSRGVVSVGRLSLLPLQDVVLYFLQLVGSIYIPGTEGSGWWLLRLLAGLFFLSLFLLIGARLYPNERNRWFFIMFLLATAGIVSVTRRELNGNSALIVGHYLIFPQLMWAGLLGIIADRIGLYGIVRRGMMVMVIFFSLGCYISKLPALNGHYAIKVADMLNYTALGRLRLYPSLQGKTEYDFVNERLVRAIEKGYYKPPVFEMRYLNENCAITTASDGSISFFSPLPSRVFSRLMMLEIQTRDGSKTYFPTDPYSSSLSEWVDRKRAGHVYGSYQLLSLLDPLDAGKIDGCRVLEIRR